MRKFVLTAALALGAALVPAAAAQDGGGAPAGGPAAKKAPKDPPKAVAAKIEEALKGVFGGSAASRLGARAALDAAVAEWEADAKEDPLRHVKWWRGALGGTLPAAARRPGIFPEKVAYIEGREATLWVSVPKAYSPKTVHPLILAVLDRGEDPRKVLFALYGDLLKEWIVVAVPSDPKESGLDVVKEPWLAAVGLRHAIDTLRVDRDRVVLDATGGTSNLAVSLGSEWAVQFAGCVLRAPTASSPLIGNLGLGSVLVVTSQVPTEPQKKVVEEIGVAVPTVAFLSDGKGSADAVQKWLAAVPPRRVSNAETGSFSWKTRPQGGEPWAYWLWVFRAADAKKERPVAVTLTRDAGGAALDLVTDNLAEGILLLNDDLLDLDREVAVKVNGREVWKGKPERRVKTALYWIGQTGERTLFVPAEVRFTVPADLQVPKKDGAGGAAPKDGDGAPPPPPPPPPPGKAGGDGGGERGGG